MRRPIQLLLVIAPLVLRAHAQSPAPDAEPVAPAAAAAEEPAAVTQRSEAELDQLLAPVALHPDPLLAQILPAATQPTDIVLAARYLADGKDTAKIDEQPWDASVKALARFPSMVKTMSDDLSWTVSLGNAFFEEPEAVMAAVQRLRLQAQAAGNLPETKEQKVIVENAEQQTVIKIEPSDPQVIYVPQYNPQIVYVEKPRDPAVSLFTFVAGVVVGAWLANDFDWRYRGVVVLPGGWRPGWHRPVIGGNVNINVNVWRPRPLPGRPLPPAWTRPPRPGPGWGGGARPPAYRPPTAGGFPNRPALGSPNLTAPRPTTLVPARPAPPAAPAARPTLQARPAPSSAFGGYTSGAAARDFSKRGAQSRQTGPARGAKR